MEHEITAVVGGRKRRKRVGRGHSSGFGKTCGKGHKGFKVRHTGPHALHEGGQMPIFRRLPKRGFSNVNFEDRYAVVNLSSLERVFADGDTVDPAALVGARLVPDASLPVKVLAKGALGKKLSISAHAFSEKAKAAIEQAGGSLTLIERINPAVSARKKRNSAKKAERAPRVSRLEKKKAAKAAQA